MSQSSLSVVWLVVASVCAVLVIVSAPFIGQLRTALRAAFPGEFVTIVAGGVTVVIAAAIGYALFRIRERRMFRYGLIASALIVGTVYAIATSSGRPDLDAVERVHFVEYGLITLLFYRAWRPLGDASVLVLPILAGLAMGTVEEWFQWFIPRRIGELRDVFLNTVAIGCGLLFSLGLDPPSRFTVALRPGSARHIGIAAAVVTMALALFLEVVHLGHEIGDPEIGSFRSLYSASELEAITRERTERWTHDPPLVLPRLGREDQYMTEGVQHVQRRNTMWEAGDYDAAWRENLILERYYPPVLDTPSFVSPTGHRWPPEQQADAAERFRATAGTGAAFVSAAYPYEIYTWPRAIFWAIATAMACAALAAGVVVDRQADRGRPEDHDRS